MSAKEWRAWTTREVDVMRANGHLGVEAVHDALLRECGTDRSARSIESQASRCPLTFSEFTLKEFEKDKEGNWIDEIPDGNDHSIDAVRYAMLDDVLRG